MLAGTGDRKCQGSSISPPLFLFPPCLSQETDSKPRGADTPLNRDYNPEILDIPSVYAVLLDNVEENAFFNCFFRKLMTILAKRRTKAMTHWCILGEKG